MGPEFISGFMKEGMQGPGSTGPNDHYTVIGINGVLGLEYKIREIPFTVGADITAALNLFQHTGPWLGSGLTIRYTF
jgi:hypothetical protein